MNQAIEVVFQIGVLIFSVVIHEVSHGYAALSLGDPTAKNEGRLTLNPFKHLDPFGSILLPAILVILRSPFLFAWAKPVPFNPFNLRSQQWGPALVGIAGPAANIALALLFAVLFRLGPSLFGPAGDLFVGNFLKIATMIIFINLFLAIFNLVPIPPLDGSKVLFAILPYNMRGLQVFLEQFGFFLLIFFIMFFSEWIFPLVLSIFRILTGI